MSINLFLIAFFPPKIASIGALTEMKDIGYFLSIHATIFSFFSIFSPRPAGPYSGMDEDRLRHLSRRPAGSYCGFQPSGCSN